jgi:anti-sigma factor RsiW
LDDYVDGALDEAAFQELEAHLAGCAACRAQERQLRALLAEAAALPRQIAPPRDLWPGVAAQLGRKAQVLAWSRSLWQRPALLAAAAAVVVAVAGVALRQRESPATRGAAADAFVLPAAAGLPPDLAFAEAAYAQAASDLRSALEARRDELAPDTLRIVDQNLQAIDSALDEIRAALAKDPANADLARLLRGAHKRKLEVLQRIAHLT